MTDENQTPNPPKKLTLSDPVPAEILSRLGELDEAKIKVAIQLFGVGTSSNAKTCRSSSNRTRISTFI